MGLLRSQSQKQKSHATVLSLSGKSVFYFILFEQWVEKSRKLRFIVYLSASALTCDKKEKFVTV